MCSLPSTVRQCYLFHMYVGVRAGGGIGDEIEDPAGDVYELYRVIFDITFFFFVIVILLAIIQGKAPVPLMQAKTLPNYCTVYLKQGPFLSGHTEWMEGDI